MLTPKHNRFGSLRIPRQRTVASTFVSLGRSALWAVALIGVAIAAARLAGFQVPDGVVENGKTAIGMVVGVLLFAALGYGIWLAVRPSAPPIRKSRKSVVQPTRRTQRLQKQGSKK